MRCPRSPRDCSRFPTLRSPGRRALLTDASGVIVGLKTSTTRGEILKSIMESVTFYFAETIDALRNMGVDTSEFVATGGGAKSDQWLQIKADIFGVPFVRPRITEGSPLGAAILAGVSTGVFHSVRRGGWRCLLSATKYLNRTLSAIGFIRRSSEITARSFRCSETSLQDSNGVERTGVTWWRRGALRAP